jgi:hypothetical protein
LWDAALTNLRHYRQSMRPATPENPTSLTLRWTLVLMSDRTPPATPDRTLPATPDRTLPAMTNRTRQLMRRLTLERTRP